MNRTLAGRRPAPTVIPTARGSFGPTPRWLCAAMLAGAALLSPGLSPAQSIDVMAVTETKPGEVLARLAIGPVAAAAPALRAQDFVLKLSALGSVPAADLSPSPQAAGASALLICVDRSGSMGFDAVIAMRNALVGKLVPRAGETGLPLSVAIVAFDSRVTPLLRLTTDPAQVRAAAAGLAVDRHREGRTLLYDAVAGGLAELRGIDAASKRMLVISDGNDEGSSLRAAELIDIIRRADPKIRIDAIGFGDQAALASGSLATLAGATGGRFAVTPSRDGHALQVAFGRMIEESTDRKSVDVRFVYPPDSGGRRADAATVEFRPAGGPVVSLPVLTALTAGAAGPAPGAEPAVDPVETSSLRLLLSRYSWWPWAVAALAVLLALVGLGALLRRRRRGQPPVVTGEGAVTGATQGLGDAGIRGPTRQNPPDDPPAPPPAPPISMPPPVEARNPRRTLIAHRWPEPGSGPIAELRCIAGPAEGLRFAAHKAVTRIGAAADNDLGLSADGFVSSHHLVLKAEAGHLYITDLGSRNGSLLNGASLQGTTRSLSPGDEIRLGHSTLLVSTASAAAGSGGTYEQHVR